MCAQCHEAQSNLWKGSHHDLAMQPADASTVLGDFSNRTFEYAGVTSTFFVRDGTYRVRTDGPDGELDEFEIAYTFGVDPLQQYLVSFPDGRYQALGIAWDSRPADAGGGRWFHLYPDERVDHEDPLHWTKRFQNWNAVCASCHSTGLRKNYVEAEGRYETEWFEMDVSCEACHGPGARHVAWAESGATGEPELEVSLRTDEPTWVMNLDTGLAEREPPRTEHTEIETCAPCPSRRSLLREDDPHGQPFLDDFLPVLLREPLYYDDGQIRDEVYVYGSFLQSKMFGNGVTCQDCHDPHGLHLRAEGNAVCASCHLTERFDSPSHHFHEPNTPGASCVDCHMPATTYMVVDPRRDHSFRVPRPDVTASIGTPNACSQCHDDRSPEWAAATIAEWTGRSPAPHYGLAFEKARRGEPGAPAALSALMNDPEVSGIVKASAAARMPMPDALRSADPLVRLGALAGVERVEPNRKHQLLMPLLDDEVRAVRIEAAKNLASVPAGVFTPDQRSRFASVLEEYRETERQNADWPESQMNLGLIHTQLGELALAKKRYEAAIRLDPQFIEAHVNLADLYRSMGQDGTSETTLRSAPDHPDVHHALGLTLVRLKRHDEALAELRRAAELKPEEPRYPYVYAVALESQGRVPAAFEVLRDATERHPNDRDLLIALMSMHRDRGELADALGYARRLAELSPGELSIRRLVAQLEAATQ